MPTGVNVEHGVAHTDVFLGGTNLLAGDTYVGSDRTIILDDSSHRIIKDGMLHKVSVYGRFTNIPNTITFKLFRETSSDFYTFLGDIGTYDVPSGLGIQRIDVVLPTPVPVQTGDILAFHNEESTASVRSFGIAVGNYRSLSGNISSNVNVFGLPVKLGDVKYVGWDITEPQVGTPTSTVDSHLMNAEPHTPTSLQGGDYTYVQYLPEFKTRDGIIRKVKVWVSHVPGDRLKIKVFRVINPNLYQFRGNILDETFTTSTITGGSVREFDVTPIEVGKDDIIAHWTSGCTVGENAGKPLHYLRRNGDVEADFDPGLFTIRSGELQAGGFGDWIGIDP